MLVCCYGKRNIIVKRGVNIRPNIRGGRRLLGTLFGEGFACKKYTDKGVSLPRPLLEKKVVHNLVQAESQVIK